MEQFNPFLTHELEQMRFAEIHAELERERFLAAHGLDLWSVLRRSLSGWASLGRQPRSIKSVRAARPLGAGHRPLSRGSDLI